ncbi:MAG: sulfatase-like hydrolase/transferase, partial [Pirellulaceae bacterium]
APARSAIISGMYPASLGAEHMRSMVPMPAGAQMFPEYLRAAGYYCTNNVKEDYNLAKSGPVWDESSGRAHWRNRRNDQPFFAVFNSTKSHESQIRARPHQAVVQPAKVRVPAFHPDTPEVRQDWAQYYDKVSEADADAGRRLRELEADGLAESTIVFYYGDHGTGMPRGKRWPCNLGLHVPLVVYFPEAFRHLAPRGYQAGGRSDRLVNFVDLAPTVLSLAGIRPPQSMQGGAFAGEFATPAPTYLFGSRGRMDERVDLVRSVTDGRYVYLRNYHPHVSQAQHVTYQFETPTTRVWRQWFDEGKTNAAQSIFWQVPKASEELYDLSEDPDEVRNLAGAPAHQEVLTRLRAAVRGQIERIRDVGFLPEGEMHARSQGRSPHDMARDESVYPLRRIVDTAELASSLHADAVPELARRLDDADSAVRYWAALGMLMRGAATVSAQRERLDKKLADASPYVRIVAAQALAQHGDQPDRDAALAALRDCLSVEQHGVFVAMAALSAVDALEQRAAPLIDVVRTMNPNGPSPDARFNSYVPRLIADITSRFGTAPATRPATTKKRAKKQR